MSPRCLGPSRPTPEGRGAAHGPRHPAYPLLPRPVISSWGFRFLSSWFLGSARVFRSEAEILCLLLFALQDPTPVRFIAWVSLFFSCCLVVFARRRRVSLFLLFRCWGNTNCAAVCGSPCVSSSCTRPSPSTRTSCTAFSSRHGSRTCGFLSFSGVLSSSASRSLSLSFSLSLYLWCRSPLLCKHI